MEHSSNIQYSQHQQVFDSICTFKQTREQKDLGEISPLIIQQTYRSPEEARAFLETKSVDQLSDFRRGIMGVAASRNNYQLGPMEKLFDLVNSVAKEKLQNESKSVAPRVETVSAPRKKKQESQKAINEGKFQENFSRFSKKAKPKIDTFLGKKTQQLDERTGGRYSEVAQSVPYLDLTRKGKHIQKTLEEDYAASIDYSSEKFDEALYNESRKHYKAIEKNCETYYSERLEKRTEWIVRNHSHIVQAYDQYSDPSLGGFSACSMHAFHHAQQLTRNPGLPSEKISFQLSPAMIQDVKAEHKAPTIQESKEISNEFNNRHFGLELRGALPVISRRQSEAMGLSDESWESFKSSYEREELKSFRRVADLLPVKGETATTRSLVQVLGNLQTGAILHVALSHVGETGESIGHDIVIQMDRQNSRYRLIDSNLGVVEYSDYNEFRKEVGDYLKIQYPEYTAFMISTYKK